MNLNIKKYVKKPVEIEAVLFEGTNWYECECFISNSNITITDCSPYKDKIHIPTLEGIMTASVGDYIIKGIEGEFYPCKPEIFKNSYQEV